MNSESKEEKEQLEKETINLNEFFNLIINQAQTNKILQNFKDNIMEFYSLIQKNLSKNILIHFY